MVIWVINIANGLLARFSEVFRFLFLFRSLQLENRGACKPLFRLQDMLLFFTTLEMASGVLAQLSDRSYFNLI